MNANRVKSRETVFLLVLIIEYGLQSIFGKYTEAFRFFDFGYFVSTEVISFPLFPVKDCPGFYTNLSERPAGLVGCSAGFWW